MSGELSGLAPVIGRHPKILLLGSMPSVASLEKQQYYGHPRNAFWPLLAQALNFELHTHYAKNIVQASHKGIAIWDVIAKCEREGSLDSAIVKGSERINPIPELISKTPGIKTIGLNGGLAATLFKRHCLPLLDTRCLDIYYLPSTSPANARMSFTEKCAAWQPVFSNPTQGD